MGFIGRPVKPARVALLPVGERERGDSRIRRARPGGLRRKPEDHGCRFLGPQPAGSEDRPRVGRHSRERQRREGRRDPFGRERPRRDQGHPDRRPAKDTRGPGTVRRGTGLGGDAPATPARESTDAPTRPRAVASTHPNAETSTRPGRQPSRRVRRTLGVDGSKKVVPLADADSAGHSSSSRWSLTMPAGQASIPEAPARRRWIDSRSVSARSTNQSEATNTNRRAGFTRYPRGCRRSRVHAAPTNARGRRDRVWRRVALPSRGRIRRHRARRRGQSRLKRSE